MCVRVEGVCILKAESLPGKLRIGCKHRKWGVVGADPQNICVLVGRSDIASCLLLVPLRKEEAWTDPQQENEKTKQKC